MLGQLANDAGLSMTAYFETMVRVAGKGRAMARTATCTWCYGKPRKGKHFPGCPFAGP
jgi:hypothetical protein